MWWLKKFYLKLQIVLVANQPMFFGQNNGKTFSDPIRYLLGLLFLGYRTCIEPRKKALNS